MPNLNVFSITMILLSLSSSSHAECGESSSSNSSSDSDLFLLLGSAFASPTIDHRPSFSMVLPEDSDYVSEGSERSEGSHRHRRHVSCGKKSRARADKISFEQRSICPFRHHRNVDHDRIPMLLEEVRCLCTRPSHLSSYTDVRCQPLQYKVPVLRRQSSNDLYVQGFEELTLACIPLKPRDESSDFLVDLKN
ncbi:hypothetical protein PFISCL1PPCAC_29090 [Pristionchus fissidentatus]|uniref:Uncharacterized protein n=1 Tax=Pristionchus fissidentatus TaxID=1538716 RepID=A0AAV5X3D5_9BILA|nr:hypothetical protein PFISCL1PPCAC_24758 [Pristionchus fissidentatus]GMT37793.1 hypothetical protein PFISCL1PPCAC_29090 [Pristionchus fissidentatus]